MLNRRGFVKRIPMLPAGAVVARAAAAGVSLSLSGCASVRYLQGIEDDGRVRVALADFAGSAGAIIQTSQSEWPIYVHDGGAGGVTAVAAHCTHRGCQPEPQGDRLVCPCHGSEFAFGGDVLQGPAERPLDRFDVTREGEDIIVWLRRESGRAPAQRIVR